MINLSFPNTLNNKRSTKQFNKKKRKNLRSSLNILKNLVIQKSCILKEDIYQLKRYRIMGSEIKKCNQKFFDSQKIERKFHFKYSYDFFKKLNLLISNSRDFFRSTFTLNKISLKGLFELSLNFNSIRKIFIKKLINSKYMSTKKTFLKKFMRSFLTNAKKLTLKNLFKLNIIKNILVKKIAFKKSISLLLNKVLLRNRQRFFSILNYGFFFTFLLKSNNLFELNNLFVKNFLFKKNVLFFKYYSINLFKNYFFRNDFIGIYNRYYFLSNDISLNFSEVFNIILTNISNYNTYSNKYNKLNIILMK